MSRGTGRLRRIVLVARKELRETLRDRRTLAMMLGFPLVVYPLLALAGTRILSARHAELEERAVRVGLAPPPAPDAADEVAALARALAADLRRLAAESPTRFTLVTDARPADVRADRIDVLAQAVRAPDGAGAPARIQLDYDSARETSARAEARLHEALSALRPPGCDPRYQVAGADLATRDERGGHLLARVLPLVVVVMLMLGALYPAIDLTAGERERGTLETTLAAPVARVDLLLGKVLAVSALASLTGLANLLSMALTSMQVVALAAPELALPVPWGRVALAALGLVPSALLFAALMVAVACTARNFKEAQNLVTPVYALFLLPATFAVLGEVELSALVALVPGVNLTLLLRALIEGKARLSTSLVVLGATAGYAALALRLAAHLFDAERLLAAAPGGRGARAAAPVATAPTPDESVSPAEALLAFVLAFALFFALLPVQARWPTWGLLAAQWLGMAGLAVAFVRARGRAPRAALGLRAVPRRALAGAALCGAGAWVPVALLVERVLAPPPEVVEQLRRALLAEGERPLWQTLLLVAVTPAVCEELLFRGVVLRGLRRGLPAGLALGGSAAIFALFHLDPYRLLPTFLLGLGLGWLALRTGSIVPGMVAHLCNNAAVILVSATAEEAELGELPAGQQLGLVLAALALIGLGVALVVRGKARVVWSG